MTPQEYRDALAWLGMTHGSRKTAVRLRISVNTSVRYATGRSRVPEPVIELLKVLGAPVGTLAERIFDVTKDVRVDLDEPIDGAVDL